MQLRAFDHLVEQLRAGSQDLPDTRTGSNTRYEMSDFVLSAFAVFFTQSPSFLAHQKALRQARGADNAAALFQVRTIPSDNQIRNALDPVPAERLFGVFDEVYQAVKEIGLLDQMRAVGDTQLIALDGTRYFSSQSANIHCPSCSKTEHANGDCTHFHSAITPVVVSPGHQEVFNLRPEFITPQDGSEKQDCEIAAAKRWLTKNAQRYQSGNVTLLGDDLFAHQPFCRQTLLHGFHFLFTCKPQSHPHLTRWVEALEPGGGLHACTQRVKGKGNRWEHHEYRWINQAPLTAEEGALQVNWCEVSITDAQGQRLFHNTYVTDHEISADNVAGLVSAGRARWKIENENNNVLKTKGYHLEHNFGHGKQHLSETLLTLNLLAFLSHTFLGLHDEHYQMIRRQLGARRTFFEDLRSLTRYICFESWSALMDFMMKGLKIGPYTPAKPKQKRPRKAR